MIFHINLAEFLLIFLKWLLVLCQNTSAICKALGSVMDARPLSRHHIPSFAHKRVGKSALPPNTPPGRNFTQHPLHGANSSTATLPLVGMLVHHELSPCGRGEGRAGRRGGRGGRGTYSSVERGTLRAKLPRTSL